MPLSNPDLQVKPVPQRLLPAIPRSHYVILALVGLIPFLLDRSWPYPVGVTIDPWVYYGYFWDYPSYVTHLFPGTYYGTRLPWIIPGYVTLHLLPPGIGTLVFVLGVFYTTVWSFYYLLVELFDYSVALFGALFLATDYYFLRAVGWYYVDGGVILYFVLALLFLTLYQRTGRRWLLFLVGWTSISMVLCHLMSIVLVPCLAAILIFILRPAQGSRYTQTKGIAYVLLGASACLIFFGAINRAVGSQFFFFLPQLAVLRSTGSIVGTYKLPIMRWLPSARWDIIPGVSIALGVIVGLAQILRKNRFSSLQMAVLFSGLGTLLMLLPLEAAGLFYYQLSYYTSFLFPICYVIIGAILFRVTGGKRVPTALIATVGILAFGLRSWTDYEASAHAFHGSNAEYVVLAATSILMAWMMFRSFGAAWGLRLGVFLLAFCVCTISAGERGYFSTRAQWRLIHKVHGDIRELAGSRKPRLWYSAKSPESILICRSVSSMYLWGFSIVNEAFPGTSAEYDNPAVKGFGLIQNGDLVVICSDSAPVKADIQKALSPLSMSWDEVREERPEEDGQGLWLGIGEVHAIKRQDAPHGAN